MKKKIICIRKYELLDEIYKQEMNLKLFEDEIREAYEEVVDKRVEILVYPKSYLVIGSITSAELRKAGRLICRNPKIGKCCKKCGTGNRLVKRTGFIKITKQQLQDIYYIFEEDENE